MLIDLDRALLNEMGISAIGDCLSILKHAKTINARVCLIWNYLIL
jgi:hypothetical protein